MLENERDGLKSLQRNIVHEVGSTVCEWKESNVGNANRCEGCRSVTVVSCGCMKLLHLWWLLGSFVPFKNAAEMQCLESGVLQTAGGIVTATVKRSIMLSTAEKEAPCSCSQDKRGFLLLSSYC